MLGWTWQVLTPEAYKARWQPTGLPQVVLFVALEEEKNELDHRTLMAFVHLKYYISLSLYIYTHKYIDIIRFGDSFLFEGSEPEMEFNPSSKLDDHVTILMMFS